MTEAETFSSLKAAMDQKKSPFTPNHLSQGWVVDSLLVFHSDFTFTPEGLSPSHLHLQPEMSVFQDLEMD